MVATTTKLILNTADYAVAKRGDRTPRQQVDFGDSLVHMLVLGGEDHLAISTFLIFGQCCSRDEQKAASKHISL